MLQCQPGVQLLQPWSRLQVLLLAGTDSHLCLADLIGTNISVMFFLCICSGSMPDTRHERQLQQHVIAPTALCKTV